MLIPRIESARFHADGNIEIEPDRKAKLLAERDAGLQLFVRAPLHKFGKRDCIRIIVAPELRQRCIIRPTPRLRPLPPGAPVFSPQHLKTGKAGQGLAALLAKCIESTFALERGTGFELRKGKPQRTLLQRSDARIVHQLGIPQPFDLGMALRHEMLRQFRQRRHIDIDRIQKQAAVRRIRAAIFSLIIEQRVQRIETDARRAEICRPPQQDLQIGKIADAPVATRADSVKLNCQQPTAIKLAFIGALRRNDQRVFDRLAMSTHTIDTKWKPPRV